MPKLIVARTTTINASIEKVKSVVTDFHRWQPWSPWLIMEPETKVTVDEDNKYYKWEGKRVGSGEMSITGETDSRIDYDLTFLTPYKSHAKVAFDLQPDDDSTRVTWHLDSNLPFFMFWMKKLMISLLESDYDRGLMMLKEYVEAGKVSSRLEIKGSNEFPGSRYVGITTSVGFDQMNTQMEKDITKLSEWSKKNNVKLDGNPFTIYHKWDMVKKQASYTTAFPVKDFPDSVDSGFVTGEIPKHSVFTIRHTGPYRYLGNLWSFGENLKRNKEFRIDKKFHPLETYVNTPDDVSDNELVTEVHFWTK